MKKTKLFSILLFLICLSVSCSIDKKIYSNGYHVDWSHQQKNCSDHSQVTTSLIADKSKTPIIEKLTKGNQVVFIDNKATTITTSSSQNKAQKIHSKNFTQTTKGKKPPPKKNEKQKSGSDRKNNLMATISFALVLLILAGVFISITTAFPFLLFFILAIPALVFGLIGLKQIKKDPSVYKNKWFAWLGIIFSGILLLSVIIFIGGFLFFIYFG